MVNQPTADREPPRQTATRPAPPVQHTASASSNAPLSLSPGASSARASAPMRTASVGSTQLASPAAAASRTGAYAVQVSSQRSEAEAQSAFRSLQGKFPSQLGSQQVLIHKADLGAKGTYYRALVGPFANANDATQLCSSLKSAGGQCIVQRN
jgi:cell division protein FtsN